MDCAPARPSTGPTTPVGVAVAPSRAKPQACPLCGRLECPDEVEAYLLDPTRFQRY